MGTINIQVVARIATNLTPAEVIVCDNSGYTLAFTFDEEWASVPERVARFVYKKGYQTLYQEQPFEGNTVDVPELHDVDMVHVGVYAGDLQTTTPAMIICRRSILGGDPIEDLPAPVRASLQRQIGDLDDLATEEKANLVAAINEVMAKAGGEISDEQVAQAVTAYLTEHPVQAGATAAQAAQIQANKEAIEQLQQTGGGPGTPGADGGYYTPAVTQPAANTLEFNFTPSKADMPAVDPVQVALPAAPDSGGNVDLTGYATEQYVQEYAQPKGNYLESTELTNAVNTALAQAKASGEFDGKDGVDGQDGYTPQKGIDYFDGKDGQPGKDGAPGADGKDYVLTEADKTEIAELAAELVEIPEGSSVTVDSAMSDTSENPVQNKVVKGYVDSAITGSWLEVY